MQTPANTNIKATTAGGLYYPEMGGHHDGTALFIRRVGYKGYCLSWKPERHEEALAAFQRLRIRPRYMDCSKTIRGTMKWSCGVTWAAGEKLTALSVTEALLD